MCRALIGLELNRRMMGLYNPASGHRFSPRTFHFYRRHTLVFSALTPALAFRHRCALALATSTFSRSFALDLLFAMDPMAPRKPTKARLTGEDPGSLNEGWSCYLGKSLVKESDLTELILTDTLAEGQATCGGEAVVPSPGDRRTVVFAASRATTFCRPCWKCMRLSFPSLAHRCFRSWPSSHGCAEHAGSPLPQNYSSSCSRRVRRPRT